MKKTSGFLSIVLLFLFVVYGVTNSQSIKVVSVDPSAYPTITAEYNALDIDGKNIRTFSDLNVDLTLKDNGIKRTIVEGNCPEGISKFSLIIVIDKSYSMTQYRIDPDDNTSPFRIDAAKDAAKKWIDNLPSDRSECCVLAFSAGIVKNPELIHTFSTDKQDLKDSVQRISPVGATDYNAAFLGNPISGDYGAFDMAKRAKYKPIIIFLTDGSHEAPDYPKGNSKFKTAEVLDSADATSSTIYALTLGVIGGSSAEDLASVSRGSGGEIYSDLSESEINNVYFDILANIDPDDFPAPCTITWETDCEGGLIDLELNIPTIGAASASFTYIIPDSVKPVIETTHQRDILFLNVDPNGSPNYRDTTFTITSKNNYTDLIDLLADPQWTLVSPVNVPREIEEDEDLLITIRYTPNDSSAQQSTGDLSGSACDGRFFNLKGGFFFVREADMGSEEVGLDKFVEFQLAICNWTPEDFKIDDFRIKGGDEGDFAVIKGLSKGMVIDAGTCALVEYRFTPGAHGRRSSTIEIDARKWTFSAEIFGNGIDNADLQVASTLDFDNTNCVVTTDEKSITLTNNGGVDVNVTSITFTPPGVFKFTSGDPTPFDVLKGGGTYTIDLTFEPGADGPHNCDMNIFHDADGSPSMVALSGFADNINISTSEDVIDFGVICPDSIASMDFTITNAGTIEADVTAATANEFSLPVDQWKVQGSGGTQDVTVEFSSSVEGDFEETLTVTDVLCGDEKTITLKGTVAAPAISGGPLTIETTIGDPKVEVLTINNPTDRDLNITALLPQDPQFEVVPTAPTVIPAQGSADVQIRYTPDQSGDVVQTTLVVEGTPCNFSGAIDLVGNPGKAVAEVFIRDDYVGLIGDQINVKIEIRNKTQVAESGAKSITTTVNFDETLLEVVGAAPPTPGELILNDLQLDGTNNDQVFSESIEFKVLSGSAATSTPLTVSATDADNGNVEFIETDGLFSLIESTAKLSISKDLTYKAGEVFEIEVMLSNADNLSQDVQKSISTDITYNSTLFEPWGDTPMGTIDNISKRRTITLTGMNIAEGAVNPTQIATYQFRAMLGNAKETAIEISNTAVEVGEVIFIEDDGYFRLDDVCDQGGDRLFDPYGIPGIVEINPNPAGSGNTDIVYDIIEAGSTKLFITDILGNEVKVILNGKTKPGRYTISLDTGIMNSGMYMIIMNTPTRTFSRRLDVVK